ncbi:RNA-directed DNA polymerase [Plebeiibacterium sediminum]|uniref:RNA-directed DNA polymerase n=1 Tax=Plebeiibacterium sediminum TaxID=2992112 RepID=A0AAE3M1D0_9BACT|nr:RNA-directed DNA polymerase [Plebeiobacterium sediminum]MCW3785501.1 RNA-directed DNA polymerase [Plebeiobacterium sediminum]
MQTVDGFTLYKNLYRPDIEYFGFFLEESINLLIHNIKEGIYEPSNGTKIHVPKKNNLVRPLTLLEFFDLLVYQALVNVIADVVYDELYLLRAKNTLFGNAYRKSDEDGSIFFMAKWKDQWKHYNKVTESYFNEGYVYFTDFDIASFFDTISHEVLITLLKESEVEDEICELLRRCLASWSIDKHRNNIFTGHGIPQGPLASSILADIYLTPVDKKITITKRLDVKYLRYVDDIRILTKNEIEGKKAIAYLDLLTRDYGLIPQSSKIGTRKVENIKKELSVQHVKFSNIANEYQKEGKKLKSSTHNQQKKQFLRCFSNPDNEEFLNKTIIRFSLYKLNKDEEIKTALLNQIEHLYPHIDAVLFYLSKFFKNDEHVKAKMTELINSDSLLFQHIIAVIYRDFNHIPFDESLFDKHFEQNNSFWLIQYFLLDWLEANNEIELIKSIEASKFHFVNRKLLNLQSRYTSSKSAKQRVLKNALKNRDNMIALQAAYHYFMTTFSYPSIAPDTNNFVNDIIKNTKSSYVKTTLKTKYAIIDENDFFNKSNWQVISEYKEMRYNFSVFHKSMEFDPSKSLMALNIFNEIVFNQIVNLLNHQGTSTITLSDNYGGNISSIQSVFPYASFYFTKVNDARNQRTDAHYKDKEGNIRIKIKFIELQKLIFESKFTLAMKEILDYTFK